MDAVESLATATLLLIRDGTTAPKNSALDSYFVKGRQYSKTRHLPFHLVTASAERRRVLSPQKKRRIDHAAQASKNDVADRKALRIPNVRSAPQISPIDVPKAKQSHPPNKLLIKGDCATFPLVDDFAIGYRGDERSRYWKRAAPSREYCHVNAFQRIATHGVRSGFRVGR